MTTPLNEVRAKVIEAVPEIVETHEFPPNLVLARPIQLADVLRAMQKVNPANITRVRIECGGAMYLTMGEEANHIQCHWDMSLPLEDQSEEVISFLHKILCHD